MVILGPYYLAQLLCLSGVVRGLVGTGWVRLIFTFGAGKRTCFAREALLWYWSSLDAAICALRLRREAGRWAPRLVQCDHTWIARATYGERGTNDPVG